MADIDTTQATTCDTTLQSAESEGQQETAGPRRVWGREHWIALISLLIAVIGIYVVSLDHSSSAATQRANIQDTQVFQGEAIQGINRRLDGVDVRLSHIEQDQARTLTGMEWLKARLK